MNKIGLRPNGWFPFLPTVIPAASIMWIVMAFVDRRPVVEAWPRISIVTAVSTVAFWAVTSWYVRKRDGWIRKWR